MASKNSDSNEGIGIGTALKALRAKNHLTDRLSVNCAT